MRERIVSTYQTDVTAIVSGGVTSLDFKVDGAALGLNASTKIKIEYKIIVVDESIPEQSPTHAFDTMKRLIG